MREKSVSLEESVKETMEILEPNKESGTGFIWTKKPKNKKNQKTKKNKKTKKKNKKQKKKPDN